MPSLRVTSESPEGVGYDLTPRVEGLRWSNTNPGGDDSCSFTYKGSWRADQPEIASRNVLRVTCGLDELWRGEIAEHDRGGDAVESVEVTAYGMGKKLEKVLMREIYKDMDLSHWGDPPLTRQATRRAAGDRYTGTTEVAADTASGVPGLVMSIDRVFPQSILVESIYESEGIPLAALYYDVINYDNGTLNGMAGPSWTEKIFFGTDDLMTTTVDTGNLLSNPDSGYYTPAASSTWEAICLEWRWPSTAVTADGNWAVHWRRLAVIGAHGLTLTGTAPNDGFTADQIVGDALAQVSGITARRMDGQSFVITHFVVDSPTPPSDVIEEANGFEPADYGTWGADDVLSRDTAGYFDFKRRDTDTQHWFATRTEADDLDLHSEIGSLFNKVRVIYEDASGTEQVVTRTAYVPDLGDEVQETTLDAGQSTQADAERLGDSYLALSGGYAPARGSVTISAPIRHYRRGDLPPAYLRADGSNIRIPDVLPTETLFALDDTPDRRTTFPIKSVEVDASGPMPVATVELDQSSDDLTALQARLAMGAGFGGGSAGDNGGGGESSLTVTSVKKIRNKRKRKRKGK